MKEEEDEIIEMPGTHLPNNVRDALLVQCLRTDLNPIFQTCIFLKCIMYIFGFGPTLLVFCKRRWASERGA